MSAFMWSAFGFFLFVLLAGTVTMAVLALAGWRQVRTLRGRGLAELGALSDRLAALERRVEAVGEQGAKLQRRIGRLNRSLARARILLGALQDVRSAVTAVRAFVPQK